MAKIQDSDPFTYKCLPGTMMLISKENICRSEKKILQLTSSECLQIGDRLTLYGKEEATINKVFESVYKGSILQISTSFPSNAFRLLPFQRILIPRRVQHLSEFGQWSSIPHKHFQQARHLRRHLTPPELRLWQVLRAEQLGIKFRNQHPIGPFIADFYARQAGLVVEVDGDQAHGSPDQQQYDQMRDHWMESRGLNVRR